MKIFIIFLSIFLLFLITPHCISAANLEISDINGHSGLPYATICIKDAPNPVSYLKIFLHYDQKSYASSGSPEIGMAKGNVQISSYGTTGGGRYFEMTFKEPLPKGSSGPILKFPFYIDGTKQSMPLSFSKLEGDIKDWTTKDGNFTYMEDDNQNPIAEAGVDRFIISDLVMDGSKSYDNDGIISVWDWTFTHRSNSVYNRHAGGKNITVTDLAPGIYDIQLDVTDNAGLTATDFMTLGVSGKRSGLFTVPGDANSDGKIGLEDIIFMLQIMSGIR